MRVGCSDLPGLIETDHCERIQHGLLIVVFTTTRMTPVHLNNLLTNGKNRVQRCAGLLEHHRNVAAQNGASLCRTQPGNIPAFNLD